MVEREPASLFQGNPAGFVGVGTPGRDPRSPAHPKRHGNRGASRVPADFGVHPRQRPDGGSEPCLLFELTDDGLFHGFADLDKPPRERPTSAEWWASPTYQENLSPDDPNSVDRQGRTGILPPRHLEPKTTGI